MNYFNDRNPWSGVAVLADYQFAGVGRKNNEWISPKGSLSLSFGFDLDFVKGIWLHILKWCSRNLATSTGGGFSSHYFSMKVSNSSNSTLLLLVEIKFLKSSSKTSGMIPRTPL